MCSRVVDKVKFDMDEGSLGSCCLGSSNGMGHVTDGCNTVGALPSLTPWERTVASDGGLFHMQYMDLGEFLTENGMAMHGAQMPSQSSQCPSTSPSAYSSCSSSSAASPSALLGLDMLGATKCVQSKSFLHLFTVVALTNGLVRVHIDAKMRPWMENDVSEWLEGV